jgi:hypothetical protein
MGDAPARPKKVLSDSRDDTGISRQAKNASVLTFVIEGKETVEIGNALDAPGKRRMIGHHYAQQIQIRFDRDSARRLSTIGSTPIEKKVRMKKITRNTLARPMAAVSLEGFARRCAAPVSVRWRRSR